MDVVKKCAAGNKERIVKGISNIGHVSVGISLFDDTVLRHKLSRAYSKAKNCEG